MFGFKLKKPNFLKTKSEKKFERVQEIKGFLNDYRELYRTKLKEGKDKEVLEKINSTIHESDWLVEQILRCILVDDIPAESVYMGRLSYNFRYLNSQFDKIGGK